MNKKRKYQDEQLGLPQPKHKSYDRSFTLGCESPSNKNPEAKNFYATIIKVKQEGGDELDQQDSAKDSNSFQGDLDSVMCVPGEAKTELQCAKISTGSTSSVNCGDMEKLEYGENDSVYQDFGLDMSMNYDERVLEFGNHVDYSCLELTNDGIENYAEKEIEDLLHSRGASANKFVLSSGRWEVDRETQQGPKNLTIDKEFEQYFSMLML
ncbi:hypothetical protein LguiB_015626 [Lonicera macranthoides]